MTSRHRPRRLPQVPTDDEDKQRRPEFRVGKYVDSSEPNEIHDALVSRVGPFDSFSKNVPSITKQEYHPSSGFLGVVRMDSVPSNRPTKASNSSKKPNDRKNRPPTSSSSSPQSSLSSGSLAPSASGVSYSCASVEQLFSQMKLPELHMSPFREPRPMIAISSTTQRAAGQSRRPEPPASNSMQSMSHHSSKHASSKSGNLIKKPQTIIASPDPMIADPVAPRDAHSSSRSRERSSNSDSRSRRPPQIPIHAKTEIRVAQKETPLWVKIGYKRLNSLKKSGRNASNPLTMPESLKRKIKTYANLEGGKRARISNSEKTTAKSSKKSHQSTTVTLPTKMETSVVKIEAEMPPRRSEPQAKPDPPKPTNVSSCPADSTSTSSFSLLSSKSYIQEAERWKEQAIEYINNGDAILGYLAFTDAAAKFVIALHILYDEYEEIKKRNKSGRSEEKHRSILHYTNAALEMCYKIRENNSSSNLGASKSTFEKLSALGYKCEARLSLLYYKMNQGQHDYMRLHKDLTDVLQQKSARFTPTSPVRSELREATLSEKEFRTLKTYLSGNQWLLKAHEKWDRGKNLATKNSQFFEIIGRLCEIRSLHLMCSLKDLSTFQTAAVKELRHAQMGTSDVSPLS